MEYEAIIGLEVHAQLLTESKIFCGCSTTFGAPPNSNTCPVCTGLPGVLPVLNHRVVEFALRAALATHCQIARTSRWARKNYFYPDLPKGYQISMYEAPIAQQGYLDLTVNGQSKRVRLTRIHMEEDAGKNIHDTSSDASLVDFNRAGVPLLEIVSEPDLRTAEEAGAYLRSLRALLQYLEVCDGNMEEGSLRCDANISVRPRGRTEFGTKTEIKNLNSFRAVEKALYYEITRQSETLASGGRIVQETRLWDADREVTRPMRSKEFAHDYRYFPDPDLLPLSVEDDWVQAVKATLPELPAERRDRLMRQYGLPAYDAEVLTARKDVADYYEAAVRTYPADPKAISNWVMDSVLRVVKDAKLDSGLRITTWPCPPEHLGTLVRLIGEGTISGKIAKTVFDAMRTSGKAPDTLIAEQGLSQVSDAGALEAQIAQVLAAHPDKVAEYRAGRERLLPFFVGQVMKATQGKANPQLLNEILKKKLAE
ncbi:MAG: Asp-tRNA(Asn)/Glu-tRNA(Gln) amidotransferase subunit GatB [Deltaproteobacteria bacterium]|nr:MAG: Asp-tRNA(Asn)/Glu-tRNA(Gln) amidotransferase subunit GatB [Deltaproteobacteria bacterium]